MMHRSLWERSLTRGERTGRGSVAEKEAVAIRPLRYSTIEERPSVLMLMLMAVEERRRTKPESFRSQAAAFLLRNPHRNQLSVTSCETQPWRSADMWQTTGVIEDSEIEQREMLGKNMYDHKYKILVFKGWFEKYFYSTCIQIKIMHSRPTVDILWINKIMKNNNSKQSVFTYVWNNVKILLVDM